MHSINLSDPLDDYDWDGQLLDYIYSKTCIPFIGPDAYKSWLAEDIAYNWIEHYSYPLEKSHPLAKIAQYLAIKNDDNNYPKYILSKYLKDKKIPDFSLVENKDTIYAVLADLNLPIYVTTNYDHCMESALISHGKEPKSEFCRWNEGLSNYARNIELPFVFDPANNYIPSSAKPLVYHLHGDVNIPQSMVLTERDYLEFVINMNKIDEKQTLPAQIRKNLLLSKLLFIGYDFEDITFRVVFQGINSIFADSYRELSIALQLKQPPQPPENPTAQQYLSLYTKNLYKIQTIINNFDDFIKDLRINWDNYKERKQIQK